MSATIATTRAAQTASAVTRAALAGGRDGGRMMARPVVDGWTVGDARPMERVLAALHLGKSRFGMLGMADMGAFCGWNQAFEAHPGWVGRREDRRS